MAEKAIHEIQRAKSLLAILRRGITLNQFTKGFADELEMALTELEKIITGVDK